MCIFTNFITLLKLFICFHLSTIDLQAKKPETHNKIKTPKTGQTSSTPLSLSVPTLVSASPKNCKSLLVSHVSNPLSARGTSFIFCCLDLPAACPSVYVIGLEAMKKLWWHIFIKWLLASLSGGSGESMCFSEIHLFWAYSLKAYTCNRRITLHSNYQKPGAPPLYTFFRQAQLCFLNLSFRARNTVTRHSLNRLTD